MKKIIEKLKTKKTIMILYCLLISFLFLLIASRDSFLYSFNDWEDAHAFFTVGKSLFNGKILYKDIFEQKGPFLYLIYGIGYLFSHTTFIGIFILEIISSTIFLYYINKIISLYLDDKYSFIIIPIVEFFLCSSIGFRQGGSCEEFTFAMIAITLYKMLKYARENDISYRDVYFIGFLAGLIFLMKYTLLGTSFAFMFFLFFSLIFNKKYKKAFLSCIVFLLGMFTAFLPWLIYFILNGALYDFYNVYIYTNLFSYTDTNISIISKLLNCFSLAYENFRKYGLILLIIFISMLIPLFFSKEKIQERLSILFSILFNIIFIYIGGIYFIYYGFPLIIFLLFALIYIFKLFEKAFELSDFIGFIEVSVLVLILLFITYKFSFNTPFIGKDKNDYIQYKFKDEILKYENPTILNYGWLDCGFYTVTDIVPNIRYFERQNFLYEKHPQNMDSQNDYIKNKLVDFVIVNEHNNRDYVITEYLDINYDKIMEYKPDYNYAVEKFILYRLKEKE